ncbi:Methionyl-tRNA synthetase, partial [hydrothermal vent metagenome]
MLTFEDFKKVKLVSAKILEAKEHPDADRLYVLKIDLGEEQRQLVAGIRNAYSTDDLIGKKIIVVANL